MPDDQPPISAVLNLAEARTARRRGEAPPPPASPDDRRPIIRITAGELAGVVDEVEKALLATDSNIYCYGNKLVQIVLGEIRTTQGKEKSLRLAYVTPHGLLYQISMAAQFERHNYRAGEWMKVDCPKQIAETYIARPAWKVPTLLGIVTCPTLRPDCSVLDQPGYDEKTGLFFHPNGAEFPSIPDNPTKAQAEAALTELKAPIEKFQFVNNASRSVALSGFITAVIRRALPAAPMHGADAPVAGSGKSYLGDIASVIATGHRAAVIGDKDPVELDKKLASCLLGGDAIIMLDNMDTPVGGQFLCQILTQAKVKPRPFGKLEAPEIPCTVMIFCNGNNLIISGDVTRRALVGRIDPQVERPELREFDFDPVEMAIERRPALVCAALTVVRAWLASGEKPPKVRLGSFERWSELVREPLMWLGEDDPVAVMDEIRKTDPELQNLRAMMEAWIKAGITTENSCQSIIAAAQIRESMSQNLTNPDLHAACIAVARGKPGEIDPTRLGHWFRRNKDRVAALNDGSQARFAKSSLTTSGLTWWRLNQL
jgi:putative DNA primase/helicase